MNSGEGVMHVNLMGIELEGAWKGVRGVNPFPDGTRIKHDGSVYFRGVSGFLHYGEVVSDPLKPEDLKKWTIDHCPNEVNTTCGTHIHVSVKNPSMYGCLLTPSFAKHLIGELVAYNETVVKEKCPETYERFKDRLDGKNRYCRRRYRGLDQIVLDHKGEPRYSQLNYCFRLKGTLEIRVLPATTNAEILCDLIDLVVRAIEGWCSKELRTQKVRFRRG